MAINFDLDNFVVVGGLGFVMAALLLTQTGRDIGKRGVQRAAKRAGLLD